MIPSLPLSLALFASPRRDVSFLSSVRPMLDWAVPGVVFPITIPVLALPQYRRAGLVSFKLFERVWVGVDEDI